MSRSTERVPPAYPVFALILAVVATGQARAQAEPTGPATTAAAVEPLQPAAAEDGSDPTDPQAAEQDPGRSATEVAIAEAEAEAASAALIAAAADEALYDSEGPKLRVYGFADFILSHMLYDETDTIEGYFGQSPQFSVGNINVYLSANLTDQFRSLLEVRFSYLPNGSPSLETGERVSTHVSDYTLFSQPSAWGGIVIERVWLEYEYHPLLTLRAGQWLTPVGIWNVDHGSPAIIPALRPYVITAGMFPIRQTGLEIYGNQLLSDHLTLGYHLTLSNGRGNASSYMDFDRNKALGGRLYFSLRALGKLTVGVSGFLGQSTNSFRARAVIHDDGDIALAHVIESQYDELAWAADVLWQVADLHVQLEVFGNEGVYTDEGRPRAPVSEGIGLVPDFQRWGGYILAAYRLPWLTLMPFASFEHVADGNAVTGGPASSGQVYSLTAGLNVRPTASVVLKAQYFHGIVKNTGDPATFDQVAATVAWSF